MKIAGMILLVLVMGVLVWLGVEDVSDAHMFGETPEGKVCENLHAGEAAALIAKTPNLLILDVRSATEQKMGHLDGATFAGTGTEAFQKVLEETDKAQPILVYCSGGFRSRLAIKKLQEHDFTQLYHMNRGYLGWCVRDRSAGESSTTEATTAVAAELPEQPLKPATAETAKATPVEPSGGEDEAANAEAGPEVEPATVAGPE